MNKVFVYSGTGNSLASAKQIARALDAEVVQICSELIPADGVFEGGVAVLVYPVYAYGMPVTVKRFIESNDFEFEYFAVVITAGSYAKGAHAETIKAFKKRKQRVHYSTEVRCVENFVHMFKLPPEEILEQQIKAQAATTERVISDVKERKTNKHCLCPIMSPFVSWVFRCAKGIFAKRYRVTEACTGCEICYKVCPPKAITISECVSFDPKLCDHCQACLQLCPHRAIVFGKIQPEGRRYRHSDVETKELFKR